MKYKFSGEDEHTFQVQHPDGSTFSIAKHAIGPGVHKKIKQLEPVKMAKGGIAGKEESEDLTSQSDLSSFDNINPTANGLDKFDSYASGQQEEKKSANFDPGIGIIPTINQDTISHSDEINYPVEKNSNPNSMTTDSSLLNQSGSQFYNSQNSQIPINNMSDAYANAFSQKESGIKGIANAQEESGKAQAEAYKAQADQFEKSQAQYAQTHAQLDAEHKKLTDAVMNEKIDPNRLFHNMSTGNKVIAAISVALAGIGQGLQGPSAKNMALEVIQKSIDQDIEAQKMELGKKHTLLSENLRRFGDLNTATQMTQLQMNAITSAKVAQIAARSGSQQSQAQAKMMLGDLGIQSAQIKQQMAMRNTAAQGGGDPSALVRWVVPEPHQKAVFEEIQRAQDTRRMGDTILKSFDQAAKENTVLKTGAGFLRTPATVLALHQSMQPTFKDLEGTVRQAAMDNTFKNITPMPGDMDSTIKTKRAALEDYLKSKAAAPTAKGFGIDLDKFGTTTTQSAPEVSTMNGQKYQKVPGGWKKI